MNAIPISRHDAAKFWPGARVFDEVTRSAGVVESSEIRQHLEDTAGKLGGPGLTSLFQVPAAVRVELVRVLLDSGEAIERTASQLHLLPALTVAALEDLTRPK